MSQPINPYESPREIHEQPTFKSDDTNAGAPIKFAGKISVQDYKDITLLVQRKDREVFIRRETLVVFGIMALVLSPLMYAHAVNKSVDLFFYIYPWIASFVIFALILWRVIRNITSPFCDGISEKQLWTEGKGIYYYKEGQVDGRSFESRIKDSSTTTLWSHYCGHRCTDRVVVLFEDFPTRQDMFSRNHFEKDKDWKSFLELVAKKLPQI